jgi:tripartite-type tricarboxylate transporter receptor subunit TctC
MLGIANRERSDDFPDVPTFTESGIDFEWGTFRGIAVPKDTPKEIVSYLSEMLQRVVEHPKFIEGMNKAGYPILYYGPDEFQDYIAQQATLMGEILPTLDQMK